MTENSVDFVSVRNAFIDQWGAMGGSWGINRTMAQIHALLMVSPEPLSCDEVMEELSVSRGNANTNLRELVVWGLVRTMAIRGSRKDYFEAEKDVWKMFCAISRERRRREIDPALDVLETCRSQAKLCDHPEAAEFTRMIGELTEFMTLTAKMMEFVSKNDRNVVLPIALKIMGKTLGDYPAPRPKSEVILANDPF